MDTAEFVLHATFKATAAAEVKSNFPADVLFVPVLAQVPLQDDTPRNYRPVIVEKHGPKHTTKAAATPATPPAATVTARIINVQIVSGGTQITMGRGTTTGATDGMHGSIRGVANGFPISGCNERTCMATIKATPDQIKASDNLVTLTP
jgi:hypothetical protein